MSNRTKIFLAFMLLSWIILTCLWHNNLIVYQTEKVKPDKELIMKFEMEKVPEHDHVSVVKKKSLFEEIRLVITGLIGTAHLVAGFIYMIQKIRGTR